MIEKTRIGYTLSLADGTQWFMAGDTKLESWIDRLAVIMNLENGNADGSRRIDFFHRSKINNPSGLEADLKESKHPYVACSAGGVWFSSMDPSSHVTCEIDNGGQTAMEFINMSYSLYPIYHQNLLRGGLPLHSSLVELDGQGILLAGPGDTGKTTCCSRLPGNWRPLCDDETLIVFREQGDYFAHPFPTWSNFFWAKSEPTYDVQYATPASAVFFLEQYPADELVPMGQGESAAMISQSSVQMFERFLRKTDKETKSKHLSRIFLNACRIAKKIPAYKLRVSLNGRFWEKIEEALNKT
jgi:SynChlorMet cassette protein ScmC